MPLAVCSPISSVMPSRWKYDRPMSRATFEARFPDEASGAPASRSQALARRLRCPACGHDRGWGLEASPGELGMCGLREGDLGDRRPRSCTAADAPEDLVRMAVHIVTSHSNGISALQLQAQLGSAVTRVPGSCCTSCAVPWSIRSLLEDLIEIDEATLPFQHRHPATGGRGRSPRRQDAHCRRGRAIARGRAIIRLAPIGDFSARSLADGWSGYCGRPSDQRKVAVRARPPLTWIHPFSNLAGWALVNLPWPAPRPQCGSTSSCSAGTAAATKPSTAFEGRHRHARPADYRTSSDNAADPEADGRMKPRSHDRADGASLRTLRASIRTLCWSIIGQAVNNRPSSHRDISILSPY